jgi:putative membrane protein
VYDQGEEPDPRFSFANERTFLAWVRTALALLAGGVALDALPLNIASGARVALSLLFIALAILAAGTGWVRWARSERAMRLELPLPGLVVGSVLAAALVAAGLALLAVLVLR